MLELACNTHQALGYVPQRGEPRHGQWRAYYLQGVYTGHTGGIQGVYRGESTYSGEASDGIARGKLEESYAKGKECVLAAVLSIASAGRYTAFGAFSIGIGFHPGARVDQIAVAEHVPDASDAANRAMMQYETLGGMCAVPLTYLIDREGKVVEAWYDYRQGEAEKELKKLGF